MQFLFEEILSKYPNIKNEMIGEARHNYVTRYQGPLEKDRKEEMEKLNRKRQYGRILYEGEKKGSMFINKYLDRMGVKRPKEELVRVTNLYFLEQRPGEASTSL